MFEENMHRRENVKHLKQICFRIAVTILFSYLLLTYFHSINKQILQQGIAEKVLRFHVLANSDSKEDQEVKLLVRDALLEWNHRAEPEFIKTSEKNIVKNNIQNNTQCQKRYVEDCTSEIQFLRSNLEQIEAIANHVLKERGFSYQASAEIETSYFPERNYGSYTFPAGWYQALRIRLGEAKGKNWWCVFYPNICYADCMELVSETGEEEKLKEVLTVEEYESLMKSPGKWQFCFRWFPIRTSAIRRRLSSDEVAPQH